MSEFKKLLYVAMIVAVIGCLSGCNFGWRINYIYQNGESYTAGDRVITEKIENIDIDYMSGNVKLIGTDAEVVSVKETSERQLSDKQKVHTWVDGTTLYIRYCASAKGLELNGLNKQLVIECPQNVKLGELKVDVSAGDVSCTKFEADNIDVYTSSGTMEVDCSAKEMELRALSGNIYLTQHGESDDIEVHASSGNITVSLENVQMFHTFASAGNVKINAEFINEFESRISSGQGEYRLMQVPEKTEIFQSAGNMTMYLPEDADLTGDFHLSSGKLFYELAFAKNGDKYVCGNGVNEMYVTSSSGDVDIKVIGAE